MWFEMLHIEQQQQLRISEINIQKRFRTELGNLDDLVNSIKQNGLIHPVTITTTGNLLVSGHRRIEAFKKLGWESIPVHYLDIKITENGEIDENLVRKAFTVSEVLAIKEYREKHFPSKQGQRTDLNTSEKVSQKSIEERRKKVAQGTGYSYKTLQKLEELTEAAQQYPEKFGNAIQKIDSGSCKVDRPYNDLKRHEQLLKFKEEAKDRRLPQSVKLVHGDFRYTKIEPNSIDLIFTDPPWAKESIYVYKDLGEFAFRVLKDGGSLMMYTVNYAHPEVFDLMKNCGLRYEWQIILKQNGPEARLHGPKLFVTYKPILLYTKGPSRNSPRYILDSIEDKNLTKKNWHEWEQSEAAPRYYIDALTVENQTVLDPFLGSGTTCIAALKLNRKFIGIEIDKGHFEGAQARIAKEIKA